MEQIFKVGKLYPLKKIIKKATNTNLEIQFGGRGRGGDAFIHLIGEQDNGIDYWFIMPKTNAYDGEQYHYKCVYAE